MPLAPLYAAEETLEERRERIKRKYLRERTVIYESDLVVEEVSQQDNERIEDSEIMLIEDTTFAKEEDMVPNRVRRPYVVPAQMRAAWMALEEETDADFEEESEGEERYEYQRYEKAYGLDRAQQNGNQTLESTSGYFSKRELFSEQFKSFMQQKNLPNQSADGTVFQPADGTVFQPAYNDLEPQGYEFYQPAWMSPSATGNTGLMSKQDQAEQGSNDRNQRFYPQPEEASYEPSVRAPALQPKIKRWNPASDDQGLNEFIDRNRL